MCNSFHFRFLRPAVFFFSLQEGCHFDVSTQADVLLRLRGELDAAGLKNTPIASSDESLTDQALGTWRGLNASARAVIGQVRAEGTQPCKCCKLLHGSPSLGSLHTQSAPSIICNQHTAN